jgi:hypothetical protein
MKKTLLLLMLSLPALAQEEVEIKKTIDGFFNAMRSSDSTALRSFVAKGARFQTITSDFSVKTDAPDGFISSVGKAAKGALDERISYETINVDGALASVWTPYSFYLNGKFSHCGVNSFSLVKKEGRWLIANVIDTRRKENCKL